MCRKSRALAWSSTKTLATTILISRPHHLAAAGGVLSVWKPLFDARLPPEHDIDSADY